jgi:hypothetical protein
MMTTSRPTQVETAALRSAFLQLVCSDEELLRAEFEAIVAASWTTPDDGAAVLGHQDRPSVHQLSSLPPERPMSSRPGSDLCWRRQRSPPTGSR